MRLAEFQLLLLFSFAFSVNSSDSNMLLVCKLPVLCIPTAVREK